MIAPELLEVDLGGRCGTRIARPGERSLGSRGDRNTGLGRERAEGSSDVGGGVASVGAEVSP